MDFDKGRLGDEVQWILNMPPKTHVLKAQKVKVAVLGGVENIRMWNQVGVCHTERCP